MSNLEFPDDTMGLMIGNVPSSGIGALFYADLRGTRRCPRQLYQQLQHLLPAMASPERPNKYGLVGGYPAPEAEDAGPGAAPVIKLMAGLTSL